MIWNAPLSLKPLDLWHSNSTFTQGLWWPVMKNGNMRKSTRIFSPSVFSQIANFVNHGLSATEIADKIGCKLGTLRVRCSQHGISLRRFPGHRTRARHEPRVQLNLQLSTRIVISLQQQARKEGKTVTKYVALLLEAIARDELYDAVIDQDNRVERSG